MDFINSFINRLNEKHLILTYIHKKNKSVFSTLASLFRLYSDIFNDNKTVSHVRGAYAKDTFKLEISKETQRYCESE